MGFNTLESSGLQNSAMCAASGFVGIGGEIRTDAPFSSLCQALAAVPNDLDLSSAVGFRVVVQGRQRELRAGLVDELYRIGREAIVNAYRHSQAKEIEMDVEYRPIKLRIAVRDNGRGIDPQVLRSGCEGHWGLSGMKERAERIGGKLRILSLARAGTEVELSVPGDIAYKSPSDHRSAGWASRLFSIKARSEQPQCGSEWAL
jgi:nitrate/nitrite-specific signal transduction histidine kinase